MLRRIAEDLVLAFGFLTRLPLPSLNVRDDRKLSEALWAFPLVGLVVGLMAGGVIWLGLWSGLGKAVSGIVALAVLALLTGAMHEDGLADFWDGLGGGRTRERKLEIMRDSHIGTYGVLALVLSYLALVASFSALSDRVESFPDVSIVIFVAFAAMLARAMIVLPAWLLPIARADGLARLFGRPGIFGLILAVTWPIVVVLLVLPGYAVPLIAGSLAGSAIITGLAWRYIGGVTGDIFGASIMMSFVGGLVATHAWFS